LGMGNEREVLAKRVAAEKALSPGFHRYSHVQFASWHCFWGRRPPDLLEVLI